MPRSMPEDQQISSPASSSRNTSRFQGFSDNMAQRLLQPSGGDDSKRFQQFIMTARLIPDRLKSGLQPLPGRAARGWSAGFSLSLGHDELLKSLPLPSPHSGLMISRVPCVTNRIPLALAGLALLAVSSGSGGS